MPTSTKDENITRADTALETAIATMLAADNAMDRVGALRLLVQRGSPPVSRRCFARESRMNLVSTQRALLRCLAPDHSGLEANVLRFDNPLQAAGRCSTFPTDE